jgi:hypothetical protein
MLVPFLLAQLILGVPGYPPDAPECGKSPHAPVVLDSDRCHYEGVELNLLLLSPTGCTEEDDGTLAIEQGGKRIEARWPGKYPTRLWALELDVARKARGAGHICGRVEAVPAGAGRVLLLLATDDRPSPARVAAILYDVRSRSVVEMKDVLALGEVVERGPTELWVREGEDCEAWRGALITKRDDELALADGDRIVSAEGDTLWLNPVWKIGSAGGRIQARPDAPRTFQMLKQYFTSQVEFEQAFADMRGTLRRGRTAAGRRCIQSVRVPPGQDPPDAWRKLPWFCERVDRRARE